MMRGETSATSVTAEQIIQWGPDLAIEVAKQLQDRAAELAEWDEDDKAGEPPGLYYPKPNVPPRSRLVN